MSEDFKKDYEEAIDALKDAEKALERCNAFIDYNYKWLEEKTDKILWAAKRKESLSNLPETTKIKCPICKGSSEKGRHISTFIDGEYSTLDHYRCLLCGVEFYIKYIKVA